MLSLKSKTHSFSASVSGAITLPYALTDLLLEVYIWCTLQYKDFLGPIVTPKIWSQFKEMLFQNQKKKKRMLKGCSTCIYHVKWVLKTKAHMVLSTDKNNL